MYGISRYNGPERAALFIKNDKMLILRGQT